MTPKITITWSELRDAHPSAPIDRLQRFGVEPTSRRGLVCDGEVGPRTRGALYLNPDLFTLARDHFASLVGALTPSAKASSFQGKHGVYIHPIAVYAYEDAWDEKEETMGNNRGAFISELYEDPNATAQQGPWCGVAGRRWIRKAYPDALPSPRHAWMAKGLSDRMVHQPSWRMARSGDQLTYHRKVKGSFNNRNGHATTVAAVDGDMVWTIEGNIDIRPGVDGVAVRMYRFSENLVNNSGAGVYALARWADPFDMQRRA